MPLTWTTDLSVGFGRIDEQHQQLFTRYNHLLQACTTGLGREAITPTLNFLAEYVEEHFAEEERYMALYDYPESDQHIREHREFISQIGAVQKDLEKNGPTVLMRATLTYSLLHWLVSHVKQIDVKLGRFLSEQAS